MKFEQENITRLMKMAVEYGRSIGFEGDFYIEPKPKGPMKHGRSQDADWQQAGISAEYFEQYPV